MKKSEEKSYIMKISIFCSVVILFTLSVILARLLSYISTFFLFFHFFIILLPLLYSFIIFILNWRIKKKEFYLFLSFLMFFMLLWLSAAFNQTGLINVAVEFLIFLEPFLFFFIIEVLYKTKKTCLFLIKKIVFFILWLHVALMYFQHFIQHKTGDDVVGLLLGLGVGAHAATAWAFLLLFYYIYDFSNNRRNIYSYVLKVLLLIYVGIMSDAKQVVLAGLISILVSTSLNLNRKEINKLFFAIFFVSIFFVFYFLYYRPMMLWLRLDRIITGLSLKLNVFSLIVSFYDSIGQFFYGLGPGNTATKLAFLFKKYEKILSVLGGTVPVFKDIIWNVQESHVYTNHVTGTSGFSLFFSWAGLFGDVGLWGVMAYITIWYQIYKKFLRQHWYSICIIIFAFILGFLFNWLEEAQFTIVAILFLFFYS